MVPKLRIFSFTQNFEFWQIRRCWFQIWQYFFKLTAQNNQFKLFWSQFWFFLCFPQFFAFWKILACWFQISQSLFPIFSLKKPKRTFFLSSLRILFLHETFLNLQPKITQTKHSQFQIWNFLRYPNIYIYIYVYIQKLKSQKQDVLEWILNKKTHF